MKYYQGLSVYGTKRKDWATAGRDTSNVNPEERHSPLHIAAFEGSLESLEWFLTDGPLRKYKEFVGNNQDNLYLKKLADAEGGVDKTLAGWLDARGSSQVPTKTIRFLIRYRSSRSSCRSHGGSLQRRRLNQKDCHGALEVPKCFGSKVEGRHHTLASGLLASQDASCSISYQRGR